MYMCPGMSAIASHADEPGGSSFCAMDDVQVVPSNTLLSDDDRAKLASLQQKQSPLRDVSFFVDGNRATISANGAVRARVWVLAPGDCSRGIRAMESHGIGALLHTMQHPPQTVQASCATKTAPLRQWASQIGRTPPGTKALQGTGHRAGGHGTRCAEPVKCAQNMTSPLVHIYW